MAISRESHRKKYGAQLFNYAKFSITAKRLAFILALASDG